MALEQLYGVCLDHAPGLMPAPCPRVDVWAMGQGQCLGPWARVNAWTMGSFTLKVLVLVWPNHSMKGSDTVENLS